MTDPYRRRQDWNRVGMMLITGLLVALVAVGAVYVFRPQTTPDQVKREQALEAQIDEAESRSDAARLKLEERGRSEFN